MQQINPPKLNSTVSTPVVEIKQILFCPLVGVTKCCSSTKAQVPIEEQHRGGEMWCLKQNVLVKGVAPKAVINSSCF